MSRLPQAQKYANLMMNQLAFLQSFVEDLLDLRQLKDGVFTLKQEVFDANETFDMILETFKPQAAAKNLEINFQTQKSLQMPDQMYHLAVEGFISSDTDDQSTSLLTSSQITKSD